MIDEYMLPFSRCLKHWIPEFIGVILIKYYVKFKQLVPTAESSIFVDAKVSALELCSINEYAFDNSDPSKLTLDKNITHSLSNRI